MTEIKSKTKNKDYVTNDKLISTMVNFEIILKQNMLQVLKKVRSGIEKNQIASARTILDILIEEIK